MQTLLSTLLYYTNGTLKPLLVFTEAASFKDIDSTRVVTFALSTLMPINITSSIRSIAVRRFHKRIERLWVFTKKPNPNKLYVDNNKGIFLSPGIVLRFMNLDQKRFLKKRLRTWHGYIKALQSLQRKPLVLHFADLNGKKSIFLNKLNSSQVKVAWFFLSLFSNKHDLPTKKSRRIKRWIRKKYYQLGVGEKK